MTPKEFNALSFGAKRDLIGVRNQIYSEVVRGGKGIYALYELDNLYIEYVNDPEHDLYDINAWEKQEEFIETWKDLRINKGKL
ncbi:MAG TPA: hypothetical protein VJY62_16890 [Bacteroidia bacterium]|nr:hypothetical protein [Bacteroidia bacterium]